MKDTANSLLDRLGRRVAEDRDRGEDRLVGEVDLVGRQSFAVLPLDELLSLVIGFVGEAFVVEADGVIVAVWLALVFPRPLLFWLSSAWFVSWHVSRYYSLTVGAVKITREAEGNCWGR